jgi:hypothetical protein
MASKDRLRSLLGVVIPLAILVCTLAKAESKSVFSPYVDAKGNISLPPDFRRNMVHLGSFYVPEGGASGMHDTYAEVALVDEFRRTGKFPDGGAIVKELREASSGQFTTGKGVTYANNIVKQWFVMVKDAKNRFPNNPSWGEGWGWALIKTDDSTRNVSIDYQKDCIACHTPVKDKDWIYSDYYPTLSKKP